MTDTLAAELAAKRTALEAELAGLVASPGAGQGDISFGKRVGDGTSIAVERLAQVAAHDRLQDTLREVRRAQDKLAEGSRGRCDGCGGPVGDARLDALPWANRCIGCAAR